MDKKEGYEVNPFDIEQIKGMLEQHSADISEILTLVHQNHQLLTMLYSRQFGAYPPEYKLKLEDNSECF